MPDDKILNKGLEALLGEQPQGQKTIKEIEITLISPGRFQTTTNFNKKKIKEITK